MSPALDYQRNCSRTIERLQAQFSQTRSAGRRRHLQISVLAQRYGCNPGRQWAELLRKDGQPRTGAIDQHPAPAWLATLAPRSADPVHAVEDIARATDNEYRSFVFFRSQRVWDQAVRRTAATRIHKEIRGCQRALWLYFLWAGADVVRLRSSYYHHHDVSPYWVWAYKALQRGETLDNLIAYLRGLLWAWSERSDHRHHSGEDFLKAAESLISELASEGAA